MAIIIKKEREIQAMREGGEILAGIITEIGKIIQPGISTKKIDQLAEKLVFNSGGRAAFKGYQKFPANVCVSINNEIVHGIPSESKIIQEGDLVKVDIGLEYKGLITDMARTFPSGKISVEAQNLMKTTQEALNLGINQIKPGNKIYDYAKAVEDYAKIKNFSPCRNLVGHGVGKKIHEDPYIPNFISQAPEENIIFKKGMTLALEPMLNAGTYLTKMGKDGWVWKTQDGSLGAHFEDTIVVTENGCEILTRQKCA
jgi:methionyl aminopeptidase